MKNGMEKNPRKSPLARHQVLVFTEEVRTVPARRRSINPLFLQAHDYESLQIIPLQAN